MKVTPVFFPNKTYPDQIVQDVWDSVPPCRIDVLQVVNVHSPHSPELSFLDGYFRVGEHGKKLEQDDPIAEVEGEVGHRADTVDALEFPAHPAQQRLLANTELHLQKM